MPQLPLFAIVLAAGSSSRFGATKQLQEFNGRPLARIALELAERVCEQRSILVVGHRWREVTAACRPMRGFVVVNTRYETGIAGSIRRGVHSVAHAAGAVLLLLADQPLVTAAHLEAVAAAWQRTPEAIVASRYAGVLGPPIVFPRELFAALSSLEGDRGARALVEAETARVQAIEFAPAAVDIDRPSDLRGL